VGRAAALSVVAVGAVAIQALGVDLASGVAARTAASLYALVAVRALLAIGVERARGEAGAVGGGAEAVQTALARGSIALSAVLAGLAASSRADSRQAQLAVVGWTLVAVGVNLASTTALGVGGGAAVSGVGGSARAEGTVGVQAVHVGRAILSAPGSARAAHAELARALTIGIYDAGATALGLGHSGNEDCCNADGEKGKAGHGGERMHKGSGPVAIQ
jgi:hypothetical protein